MNKTKPFGTCQSEEVIEHIFGSVSEFARFEEHGDNFAYQNVLVEYDEDTDIHYFFWRKQC
jgi:hypothetical protein